MDENSEENRIAKTYLPTQRPTEDIFSPLILKKRDLAPKKFFVTLLNKSRGFNFFHFLLLNVAG